MTGYWWIRVLGALIALAALGCGGSAHDPAGDESEALATASQALNSTLPEVPASARDVAMIVGNQYTRPMVPPFRTSLDGRVAVNLKMLQDRPGFFLFTPEKLTAPIALNAPGATMLASTTPGFVRYHTFELAPPRQRAGYGCARQSHHLRSVSGRHA